MKRKKIKIAILTLIFFIAIFFCNSCNIQNTREKFYLRGDQLLWNPNHTIISIHDGDTFKDETNNIYRLFSIDTPESTQFSKNKSSIPTVGLEYFWAKKATHFVKNAILNKKVEIITKQYDIYKRKVAAVFYKDIAGNVRNLAMELVKNGLARVAFISKTNKKFKVKSFFFDYMKSLEEKAKFNKIGVFKYEADKYRQIFPKNRIGI